MDQVLLEISNERTKQDLKWGQQNHCPKVWLMILGEEVGEANKAVLDSGIFKDGIFSLPVKEKLSTGKGCYREELVQIAAVAVAMIQCLDRNN